MRRFEDETKIAKLPQSFTPRNDVLMTKAVIIESAAKQSRFNSRRHPRESAQAST